MKFGESGIRDPYSQRRRGIAQDAIMRFLVSPERVRVDGRIALHINLLAPAWNPAGRAFRYEACCILWKSYQTRNVRRCIRVFRVKRSMKTPDIPEFRHPLCALTNTPYRCDKDRCVGYPSLSVNVLGLGVQRVAGRLYDASFIALECSDRRHYRGTYGFA